MRARLLWMDEILHHLKAWNDDFPAIPTNNGFNHGFISWCEMAFATIHSIHWESDVGASLRKMRRLQVAPS